MRKIFGPLLVLYVILACCFSCSSSEKPSADIESVRVRIKEEPDRLHPILSKTGISQQIESKIFLPLLAPHPQTFSLEPILLKQIPNIIEKSGSGLQIDFTLRDDARWPDGSAITVRDVDFTLKSIFAPGMEESNLRAYFDAVDSITYIPSDSLSFSLHLSDSYILALPATGSLNVLPARTYDPENTLAAFSLSELRDLDSATTELKVWADKMKSAELSRTEIRGSGPYALKAWETGRYIHLSKKEDWWAANHPIEHPILEARPQNLFYQIIPDESTAIQLLKSGQLDILSDINPLQVKDFIEDETLSERFAVHFSNVLNQYVILLNTKDPVLKDKAVRRALAHLVDVDQFIADVLQGFGSPALSPIHPDKPFFDSTVRATPFSIQKARDLLEENGWLDLENSGVRKKRNAEGQQRDLRIEILITGSSLSQSIALKLQETAAQAGMQITIATLSFRNILQKMKSGDFQMTPLSIRSSPFPYDPYQTWHTDNIGSAGSNFTRFGSDSSDAVIERIRTTAVPEKATEDYKKFQALVNRDYPVIYLAAPLQPLVTPRRIKLPLTAMKPGYYENAVEISSDDSAHAK